MKMLWSARGQKAREKLLILFQEIDELVDEWVPQPLVDEPSDVDKFTLASVPVIHGPNGLRVKLASTGKMVCSPEPKLRCCWDSNANLQVTNLATVDWTGMIESDKMKQVAIDTLKLYGVGSCGPSGFYGTIGELAGRS
jgi:serine palmitoyltransferase